jgi:DNA-directed RNA polymerase subunit E'/Rpb7
LQHYLHLLYRTMALQDDLFPNLSATISSPYINNELEFTTTLMPHQMDNKFYIHLKNNVIKQYVGKCYENCGYIKQIYKITEHGDGVIEPEDRDAAAKYVVKALCKICIPRRNRELICKIDRMNNEMIGAVFGPINVIVRMTEFNPNKFLIDSNRHLKYKFSPHNASIASLPPEGQIDENTIVQPNMHVRVFVYTSKVNKNDDRIISLGMLMDIANEDEIAWYNYENDSFKNMIVNEEEE